jgi:hypothetical protein
MTVSETLFEQYCTQGNISLRRLTPDGSKTPDFELTLEGKKVIVEIKELTPNDGEKLADREFNEKGYAVWGDSKVGNRVRYKIDKSKHQLKRFAEGKYPALLVLYDARPSNISGIYAYEILVAMYGFESIDLHVPKESGEPVRMGEHRFGKGKKVGPDRHSYVSALAVLREAERSTNLHLDVYDNIFSTIKIPYDCLGARDDMTVFTIPSGPGNQFRRWVKL